MPSACGGLRGAGLGSSPLSAPAYLADRSRSISALNIAFIRVWYPLPFDLSHFKTSWSNLTYTPLFGRGLWDSARDQNRSSASGISEESMFSSRIDLMASSRFLESGF